MVGREEPLLLKQRCIAIATALLLLAGCEKDKPMAPGPQPPANAAEVVELLATAYRTQDFATFSVLLADDFLFILAEPNPDTGETQWNVATERRIHSRMFDPERIPISDPPLPMENWLQHVSITLTAQADFVERADLYTTYNPPGPLDPTLWKAESATYSTDVLFLLKGETDYQVWGRSDFTIITDLTKNIGDPGKFFILRWEDLGAGEPLRLRHRTGE